jgi:C4-dicarboxylate transporter DctM subunit
MFGLEQNTLIWLITLLTFVLFVTGTPIFLCVATWTLLSSLAIDFTIENIGTTCYQGISSYALLAMPLFILTGDLIGAGGIARKLARFASLVMAPFRGGLALANILCCSIFAAISGSNSATVATIGRIMIPELVARGYHPEFAAVNTASGGIVGILIPPSILMIIYAFSTNISVMDLFKAGWLPGGVLSLSLMAGAYFWSRKHGWGKPEPFQLGETLKAGLQAYLGLLAVVLILVIIYGGIASPTEASGVVAAYCLVAALFSRGGLKLKDVPKVFMSSGRVCGMLAPVIAVSVVLQQVFSILGLHAQVADFVKSAGSRELSVALMIAIILAAGCIMESISITIIMAPVMAPIAHSLGVDPIHFGIIFIVSLCIGFITPPFGLDLFVASGITGIPYGNFFKWLPPYVLFNLIALAIIASVPWISLVLVRLL